MVFGQGINAVDCASCASYQVQVRRRETDRQQEARLRSHAYLKMKEEEEPWVHLEVHTEESGASSAVKDFLCAPATDPSSLKPLAPMDYLPALIPESVPEPER